jgi:hypothetical protein
MGNEMFDVKRLRLSEERFQSPTLKGPPKPLRHRRFLKGPIPWDWLEKAAQLPGKALAVGMALWLWAGMKRSRRLSLSISSLSAMGVKRNAGYRAMNELERAGLISVVRHTGRKPKVTLLDVPALEE